jgi:hypothetical protein
VRHVKALSIDKSFKEMTIGSKTPLIVHSVFERTVNILIEGELFTLASNQIDNAPATLVIDLPNFNECAIDANTRGFISPGKVEITGKLSIDISLVPTWECQLINYPVDTAFLIRNCSIAIHEIRSKGNAKWLLEKESSTTAFDKEMARMLKERTTKLLKGFQTEDTDQTIQYAKQLIGLGQGLTPSGDDFLVGLLLAFSMNKQDEFCQKKWSQVVVKEAENNTNIISCSALKYAAVGQTRETIGLFIKTLATEENEEQVKKDLTTIMKIGSSSGTEMAWGILSGLTLLLKQGEQNDNTSKN